MTCPNGGLPGPLSCSIPRCPCCVTLCACGWSDEEHDPAEHRPRLLAAPTPCPTCGGAGIVDTSPPGVKGSAP